MFSVEQRNLTEKSRGYLGQMQSNFFGSFYSLYDSGSSPSIFGTAKRPRVNLLTVNYVHTTRNLSCRTSAC